MYLASALLRPAEVAAAFNLLGEEELVQDLEQLYTTIWFDPGGTTGWAIVSVYPECIGPEPYELWAPARIVLDATGQPSMGDAEAFRAYEAERNSSADYLIIDNIVFWTVGEFTGRRDHQVDAMIDLVEAWPGSAPIGQEDFILRTFRMDPILLEPVRVMERFDHMLRDTGGGAARGKGAGRQSIKQQPSLAMTHLPDERLRLMRGGEFINATLGRPHARDALRHALTFLRREKEARFKGRSHEIPVHILP